MNILLENNKLFDKLKTHKEGLKHFAFSLFLFNENNELLIQKRSKNKYHSPNLWSNTCCSHFRNIEEKNNIETTIKNRVFEEFGIKYNGEIKFVDIFEYNEKVPINLIENEIDYIYIGKIKSNTKFNLNKDEIQEIKFVNFNDLLENINEKEYTIWFYKILRSDNILDKLKKFLN